MEETQGGSDLPSKDNNKSKSATTERDSALRTLIEKQAWQICPDFGMGVERTSDCPHMVCFCGRKFCYGRGERWSSSELGYPPTCGFLDEEHESLLTTLPGKFDQL